MIVKRAYNEADFRRLVNNKHATHVVLMTEVETAEPLYWTQPKIIMCDNPSVYWKYLKFHGASAEYDQNRSESSTEDHSAIVIPEDAISGGYKIDIFNLYGNLKPYTTYDQSSTPWLVDGIQSGIMGASKNSIIEIANCNIKDFNWGSYWHFNTKRSIIKDSTIIGANNEYFNYGTWLGGSGSATGQDLFMINCFVEKVRHAIGASGHLNNYYATRNTIFNTIKHVFDRHAVNGYGGGITHIVGNRLITPDRYAFSIHLPHPLGSFEFKHNILSRSASKPVGEISGTAVPSEGYSFVEATGTIYMDATSNTYGA